MAQQNATWSDDQNIREIVNNLAVAADAQIQLREPEVHEESSR